MAKITGDFKCVKDRYLTVLNLHGCEFVTGQLKDLKHMSDLEVVGKAFRTK